MAVHPRLFHLDTCAGTGGFSLALKLVYGHQLQTVAYVERDSYAAAALVARMGEKALDQAPIWDNVKTLTCARFRDYMGRVVPPAERNRLIITGGYPCQPFSFAGKRLGERDPRHLWPWLVKAIDAYQPGVCFFENVPGHLRLGFGRVRRNLRERGYRVAAGLFTAAEVGASHQRARLFILAARGVGYAFDDDLADAEEPGRQGAEPTGSGGAAGCVAEHGRELPLYPPGPDQLDQWRDILGIDPSLEPAVCRMADGAAHRVDRLRLLGNGVVPLAVAYAYCALWAALLGKGDRP